MAELVILFLIQIVGGFFLILCISYLKNPTGNLLNIFFNLVRWLINELSWSQVGYSNLVCAISSKNVCFVQAIRKKKQIRKPILAVAILIIICGIIFYFDFDSVEETRINFSIKDNMANGDVSVSSAKDLNLNLKLDKNNLELDRYDGKIAILDNQNLPTPVLKVLSKHEDFTIKAATQQNNYLGTAPVGTVVSVIKEIKITNSIKLSYVLILDGELKNQLAWVPSEAIKPANHVLMGYYLNQGSNMINNQYQQGLNVKGLHIIK